jgi:ketosteroid isomerase-like protein
VRDDSPIARLLGAIVQLDAEAATALFAHDACLCTADGRRADGIEAVRRLLTDFLAQLRSAACRMTGEWQDGDVWIAEFEGTYELRDWLQTGPLPRVLVLRQGPDGIADVRVYGRHERALADHPTGEEGLWIGGRWIPPL